MHSLAWRRHLPWLGAVALSVALGAGCRTTTDDVERWASTKQGPRKLVAVVTHDKYPIDLRVEAARTLIAMKPRNGKRLGITGIEGDVDNPGLIRALVSLPGEERTAIVSHLVPVLVAEMGRPLPPATKDQARILDPTVPFKDAAFALLTAADQKLVAAPADRAALQQALADWCLADFARRVDDPAQLYGVEQVLRYLGADGVRRMPTLLHPEGRKAELVASLIAELGDNETKRTAGHRLVELATDIASPAWKQRRAPMVKAANEASRLKPSAAQFAAQLDQYQEEELLRLFSSMKRVAGRPVVDFLLAFAQDATQPEKRRAAALAALEGNIVRCATPDCDAKTLAQIATVMTIARSSNAPDSVRGQALQRIGEMPRRLVVDQLYALFEHEQWKVRWMAVDLVLKMSDSEQVEEVLQRLHAATRRVAIAEPLQYGFRLGEVKGATPPETLAARLLAKDQPLITRLSAIGYYFHHGKPSDRERLSPLAAEGTEVPESPDCGDEAMGCVWECEISEGGAQVVKEVATVGQFVKFCVEPALEARAKSARATSTGSQAPAVAPPPQPE